HQGPQNTIPTDKWWDFVCELYSHNLDQANSGADSWATLTRTPSRSAPVDTADLLEGVEGSRRNQKWDWGRVVEVRGRDASQRTGRGARRIAESLQDGIRFDESKWGRWGLKL